MHSSLIQRRPNPISVEHEQTHDRRRRLQTAVAHALRAVPLSFTLFAIVSSCHTHVDLGPSNHPWLGLQDCLRMRPFTMAIASS
jgi:hypothetical protein